MRNVFAVITVFAPLCLGSLAQADVFNLGTGFTNLVMVAVGDAGNAADTRYEARRSPYGSVGYNYNIGKYEVTAKQYTDFLNNKAKTDNYGLYNTRMADTTSTWMGCNIQRSGGGTVANPYTYSVADNWANRPVNYVSFWDSCRFANWLGNGQGNGSAESGAYTLNGYNGQDGRTIGRNAGWTWAVTSEDEWYKGAYYKGGGTNAGYWYYPTISDIRPSNVGSDGYVDPGNHANYNSNGWASGYTLGSPYYRTNVGEFEYSPSAYGTFDQGGNVWEWNEAIVDQRSDYAARGLRGGSFYYGGVDTLQAPYDLSYHASYSPGNENYNFGFRVSQVPEPSSIIALLSGLAGLLGIRRRRICTSIGLKPSFP